MRVSDRPRSAPSFRLRRPGLFWGLVAGGSAVAFALLLLLVAGLARRSSSDPLSALGLPVAVTDPLADGRYLLDHAEWMTEEATPAKLQSLVDALADRRPFDAVVTETGEWFPIKGTASEVRWLFQNDPVYQTPTKILALYAENFVDLVGRECLLKLERRFVIVDTRSVSHDPLPRDRIVSILRQQLDTDHPWRYRRD